MVARDVLAAVLIVAGVAATSCGGFLVSPTVGFSVLGAELLVLGVALGFGESGEGVAEGEETVAGVGAALQLVRGPEPEPAPELTPAPSGPDRPAFGPALVPLARYLGAHGGEEKAP